jgi:general secretion pathway protein M
MKAQWRALWESRSPLERSLLAALGGVIIIALYAAFVFSAERTRKQLGTSVATLRTQAAGVDAQAAELGRLRTAPAVSTSRTDLRTLVQTQADGAGLARALTRLDAVDTDQVVVVFGNVDFGDWLEWIGALSEQQVRVDTCRIEALSNPGVVSITATLMRPKSP